MVDLFEFERLMAKVTDHCILTVGDVVDRVKVARPDDFSPGGNIGLISMEAGDLVLKVLEAMRDARDAMMIT